MSGPPNCVCGLVHGELGQGGLEADDQAGQALLGMCRKYVTVHGEGLKICVGRQGSEGWVGAGQSTATVDLGPLWTVSSRTSPAFGFEPTTA